MELYCPVDVGSFPVRALIGNAQNTNKFQNIPLNLCVADALSACGLYHKYTLLVDGESVECPQGVTDGLACQLMGTPTKKNSIQHQLFEKSLRN